MHVIDNDRKIIIVNIELLNGRCPTYTVVSGYITDLDALLTNASHLKQEGKRVYAHGMRTRHLFIHEWIKWIIECFHHLVSQLYPKLVTDWPLLKGCTFKAYALPPKHYLLVLQSNNDKTFEGTDNAVVLPFRDHPSLPPSISDIDAWYQWCRKRLLLSHDQWPFIFPVYDTGKSHNQRKERELLSEEEMKFWMAQLNYLISMQLPDVINTRIKNLQK